MLMNNKSWRDEANEYIENAKVAADEKRWQDCTYWMAKIVKMQADRLIDLDLANKNYRDIVLKAYRRRATEPDHYDQEHLLDRRY
jgi:hypothetical protein